MYEYCPWVVVCRAGADEVVFSGCTLELPPAEYERLARLAETGSGQVVLKLSSKFERVCSSLDRRALLLVVYTGGCVGQSLSAARDL